MCKAAVFEHDEAAMIMNPEQAYGFIRGVGAGKKHIANQSGVAG